MSTIVLCGGSYYDFDSRYPGLHWADRLAPNSVYRLARGGASNFAIWHQVRHAIEFKPDLLLICFTSCPRVEFLKGNKINTLTTDTQWPEERMWHYRNNMLDCVDYALPAYNEEKLLSWMPFYIEEFEILKNYLYIKSALDYVRKEKINYYFTLGNFEVYNNTEITGIDIDFTEHNDRNLLPNGSNHKDRSCDPYFHIKDENWHENHAELVKKLCDQHK